MNYSDKFSLPHSEKAATGPLSRLFQRALNHALSALERTGREAELESLKPRRARNHMSRFHLHAISGAATVGGVTGSLGILGAAVDLPLFYIQAMKHLVQTSVTYGFDPHDPDEQRYLLCLLGIGHLPTLSQRKNALEKLQVDGLSSERMLAAGALLGVPRRLLTATLPRFISPMRILNPVAGAALNSVNNSRLMEAILKTAQLAYEKRRESV